MKKLIACDLHGVLADLVGRLCTLLQTQGHEYKPEDFTQYNFFATLSPEAARAVHLYSAAQGMATSIPWYPGANMFLRTLQDIGDVAVVTAPWKAPSWDAETRDWLRPYMPVSNVLSVAPEAKPWACAAADVFIEDRPDTLRAWLHHAKPSAVGVLIDRPWNRHDVELPGRIVRCTSYGQALRVAMQVSQ